MELIKISWVIHANYALSSNDVSNDVPGGSFCRLRGHLGLCRWPSLGSTWSTVWSYCNASLDLDIHTTIVLYQVLFQVSSMTKPSIVHATSALNFVWSYGNAMLCMQYAWDQRETEEKHGWHWLRVETRMAEHFRSSCILDVMYIQHISHSRHDAVNSPMLCHGPMVCLEISFYSNSQRQWPRQWADSMGG